MKKTILPPLFAAVASVFVTVYLFDVVATMGRYTDAGAAVSAIRSALYHAACGRGSPAPSDHRNAAPPVARIGIAHAYAVNPQETSA